MFNRSKALINAFIRALVVQTQNLTLNATVPTHGVKSRGKSGKVSHKPSGAAALKRAATKRNNIRKHS